MVGLFKLEINFIDKRRKTEAELVTLFQLYF